MQTDPNVQQQNEINLLNVLELAGEMYQPNRQDRVIVDLNRLSTELQAIDHSNVFFLRVGTDSAAYYYALRYRQTNPSGWYYFDRMIERSSAGRRTRTDWFLLIDSAGNLAPNAMNLISRFSLPWGTSQGQLNLQIIEATRQRQDLLQRYTQYFRHVSNDAALAVLGQHRLRLSSRAASIQIENELESLIADLNQSQADTPDADLHEILHSSLTPEQILEARLNNLEASQTTALQNDSELSMDQVLNFINQTSTLSTEEKLIQHLNLAINNSLESSINKIKFIAIRMFLEGNDNDVESILKTIRALCAQYNIRDAVWDLAKFYLMWSYFKQGGITLLRGFEVSHRQNFPPEMMQSILSSLEVNPNQESITLLNELRQNLSSTSIAFSLRTPSLAQLEDFLTRCGYLRSINPTNNAESWQFNTNLSQTEAAHLTSLQGQQAFQASTAQKRASETHAATAKKPRFTQHLEIALKELGQDADYRSTQQKSDQINELASAQTQETNNFNKLKCLAVKLALQGLTLAQIQEACDLEVESMQRIQSFKLSNEKIIEMLKYYLLGGLPLLRGFAHMHESTFSAQIMNFILNAVQADPRITCVIIHNRLVAAHNNGNFPSDLTPPTLSSVRKILIRFGYTHNPVTGTWSL